MRDLMQYGNKRVSDNNYNKLNMYTIVISALRLKYIKEHVPTQLQ